MRARVVGPSGFAKLSVPHDLSESSVESAISELGAADKDAKKTLIVSDGGPLVEAGIIAEKYSMSVIVIPQGLMKSEDSWAVAGDIFIVGSEGA